MAKETQRLAAVDVLRGITVMGMILVNNAGGPYFYACLSHKEWNGMSLADMVFPFFLFIMGLTTYLSLSKSSFRGTPRVVAKVVRRTLLILLIGWLLHLLETYCLGRRPLLTYLRLTGVLPRIALCYLLTALLALTVRHRYLPFLAAVLLAGYGVLLVVGHGYANDISNVLATVDHRLLSSGHLYQKTAVDPEGLLSTIAAVSHTLIGFCCGRWLAGRGQTLATNNERLLLVGSLLVVGGLLVNTILPLNKRVWSPSFVLVTCGAAAMLLAVLVYVIDLRRRSAWSKVFMVYGVNPLFLYVLSEAVAVVMAACGAKANIYHCFCAAVGDPYVASLLYAVVFTVVMGIVGAGLYQRKIYIKV